MNQDVKPVIEVGSMKVHFLVEGVDCGGSVSMFESEVPAASVMAAAHSHDGFEETIYGIEGETTWTVDGQEHDVGPGQALCIQRGSVHAFENRRSSDARFLAIATPGVFGAAYFEEIGEVLGAAAGGAPDRDTIERVMRRHGLTPAQPSRV
jgi:quercetin dioxygenase-like cupin family protein